MRRLRLLALFALLPSASAEDWKPNLPDREQFDRGQYVFERNCIVCHGVRGDGLGEMAASLVPKPRSFRSGIFKYGSTPPGKLPTDEDLMRVIRGGLAGTAMGTFGGQLTEGDLRAVAEYVKRFSRKWRHEENYAPPVKVPAEPDWWSDNTERTRHAAAGKITFTATCAACHGEKADGTGPAAAALRDEWGHAITPANLRTPTLRTGNEPRDLHRVLLTGIGGTPMVSFAETFTDAQRWELVAYLMSLRDSPIQTADPGDEP